MEKYRNIIFFYFFAGDKEFFYSHPKLKKLEEVVVEHFKSWNGRPYLIALRQGRVIEKVKTLTHWFVLTFFMKKMGF